MAKYPIILGHRSLLIFASYSLFRQLRIFIYFFAFPVDIVRQKFAVSENIRIFGQI